MSKKNNLLKKIFSNVVSCFTTDSEQKDEWPTEKPTENVIDSEHINTKLIYARGDSVEDEQTGARFIYKNIDDSADDEQIDKILIPKNPNKNAKISAEDATEYNYNIAKIEDSVNSLKKFTVPPTPNNSATINCVKDNNQQQPKQLAMVMEQYVLAVSKLIKALAEYKDTHQSNDQPHTEKQAQFLLNLDNSNERFLEGESNNLNMSSDNIGLN